MIVLYFQDWFGIGDIRSFLYWTIPLAIGLGVSGASFLAAIMAQNKIIRTLLILFTSGLISLGITFVVHLFIGVWYNAFSIPILFIWIVSTFAQLLFLDIYLPPSFRPKKIDRIILGICVFPIVLLVSILAIHSLTMAKSYLNKPTPETFLIPVDFKGKIRIIYGEKCGINPLLENKRRILEIPDNGLLIIQPKFKAGSIDHIYLSVDSTGKREELDHIYDFNDKSKGVRLQSSGNIGGAMPDGGFSSKSNLAIKFTDFYVSNGDSPNVYDQEYSSADNTIDSLTRILVDKCRKKIQ
jgi:hypothetical protein